MKTKAFRYTREEIREEVVEVSNEEAYTLTINDGEITSLYASPRDLKELAVGYLISKGYDNISSVKVDGRMIKIEADESSENELRKVSSEQTFRREVILDSLHLFQGCSEEWSLTGGTHSASLVSSEGTLLKSFEDVGRRNSLYKVIGWAFLSKQPLVDKFILFTGRISGDVAEKIARVDIPLIVSNTAPLSRAIDVAGKIGVTVVGFARGPEFTVYSNPWRII